MARLGDVCLINPKPDLLEDTLQVSFVPMQKVSETGDIDVSEIKLFWEVKKGFTAFRDGDVLLAKITPCMENGKGAIAKGMSNGVGFGSTEFHVLRPNYSQITSEWLFYLTSWEVFRKDCEVHMTGSAGQKRVPKAFLDKYEIRRPTVDEQQNLVRVLDCICNLISLRKQQLDKLDELAKARFAEMFGDPVQNNKKWPLVPLKDIAEIRIGPFGTILHKEDYIECGHALVNPSHIVDGKICIDPKLTISDEKYGELASYALQVGDIVLGRRGEMGRCAVVYEDGLLCGTGSMTIRPNGKMLPYFLQNILSNPTYRRIIEDKAVGVTMMNLNVPIVSELSVPLLPLKLQEDFIGFLGKVDKSKLTIQQSLDKLEVLKKALMQKYFGGKNF